LICRKKALKKRSRQEATAAESGGGEDSSMAGAGAGAGAQQEGGQEEAGIRVIYDLACGHGLLGCLLAYRFPRLR
jgi:hypothetical protein